MELFSGLCFRDFLVHLIIFYQWQALSSISRDIFEAMRDGHACRILKELLVSHVKNSDSKIDAIVALEARGFLFGFVLSAELGLPFVPIRKKGKLPGKCHVYEYALEYGTDSFEMQEESLRIGQKVLIIDDVLATGGSMLAACELVKSAGAIVEEVVVLIEKIKLNGRARIPAKKIHALIKQAE